eukprot:4863-Heterococcus_DN1.PRE.1
MVECLHVSHYLLNHRNSHAIAYTTASGSNASIMCVRSQSGVYTVAVACLEITHSDQIRNPIAV